MLSVDLGLLRDINTSAESASSEPGLFTEVNGLAYFAATTATSERGLWRSDGTEQGTYLVSQPALVGDSGLLGLANLNGVLYVAGKYLSKSDGTASGTVCLKCGAAGSGFAAVQNPTQLINVSGTLFFRNGYPSDYSLWKSDGTEAGTVRVSQGFMGNSRPGALTNVNGTLFFQANDTSSGRELWKSDGTDQGTVRVRDIYSGSQSSEPGELTNVNGALYFVATDRQAGRELWKSDGTESGTVRVGDFWTGGGSSNPRDLVNVGGTLFFTANEAASRPFLAYSNGTEAGTVIVHRDDASCLVGVGNAVFYSTPEGLWHYKLESAMPTFLNSRGSCLGVNHNGILVYSPWETFSEAQLWRSDGTPGGTFLLKDVAPRKEFQYRGGMANLAGTIYFAGRAVSGGLEPWVSDGTAAGTRQLRDIHAATDSATPTDLEAMGDRLFFAAQDGSSSAQLWVTDGTFAGTTLVSRFSGFEEARVFCLTNVQGTLYFGVQETRYDIFLWRSNGTSNSTYRVNDRVRIGGFGTSENCFPTLGNDVYFGGWDPSTGQSGLWKSDGTTEGTTLVAGPSSGGPSVAGNLIEVQGKLYFQGIDAEHGLELWQSDGTNAGTLLVKDINSTYRGAPSHPSNFVQSNGKLFFTAYDGIFGPTLWISDGSEEGTISLMPPATNGAFTNSQPVEFRGRIYFPARDTAGAELWVSDGTVVGTTRFKDIRPGIEGSEPSRPTVVGGDLYFSATDGILGRELWSSDGTSAGTRRVKDIRPGPESSSPIELKNIAGTLFFAADDGIHGEETWQSDGTESGTSLVEDIVPGPQGSTPGTLDQAGDRLFLAATTDYFGREIWSGVLGTRAGDFNRDLRFDLADIDLLVVAIATHASNLLFDLDNNARVDRFDLENWLMVAGEVNLGPGGAYLYGDANLDGQVDGADFGIWDAHKFTAVAAWSRGDFNADGLVDGADFGIWNAHKFRSARREGHRFNSASARWRLLRC